MQEHYSDAAYRQASADGATHIGLLTIVYDALAQDFRDAGQSVRKGDISARCKYSNHALLLLGHLEVWADYLDDAVLATSLKELYGFLRVRILVGQQEVDQQEIQAKSFEALAHLVAETRATWQLKEQKLRAEQCTPEAPPSLSATQGGPNRPRQASSWSA